MNSGLFRPVADGGAFAIFGPMSAQVLASFAAQLIELIRDDVPEPVSEQDPLSAIIGDGPVEEPDNPVLARLFPVGYRDDEEAASDFRRFTERDLRDAKVRHARCVLDTLAEAPRVDADQLDAWTVLTGGVIDDDPEILDEADVADAEPTEDDHAEAGGDTGEPDPETAVVAVRIEAPAVQSWLRCLTDIRLALATLLDVEEDDEDRWDGLPEDDPQRQTHDVYQWLGFVQETLVSAIN